MSLRAVLFDAAGTLIETAEPVGETYARLAAQAGVELPAWRLDDAFRRARRGAPPMVFPDAAASEVAARERTWWRDVLRSTFLAADSTVRFPDFDAFFDAAWRHFADPRAWRVCRGAPGAVASLRDRGLRTGVLSNFDQRLPDLLEGLDLLRLFDTVVLPAQSRAWKPDPAAFGFALERLGVRAQEAVYVGDDPERDVDGARRAGMRALDVSADGGLETLPARVKTLATLDPSPRPPGPRERSPSRDGQER